MGLQWIAEDTAEDLKALEDKAQKGDKDAHQKLSEFVQHIHDNQSQPGRGLSYEKPEDIFAALTKIDPRDEKGEIQLQKNDQGNFMLVIPPLVTDSGKGK